MLFLDGVYVEQSHGSARFRWVKAPTSPELTQLTHTIAHRVGRYLERQGLLERDVENNTLLFVRPKWRTPITYDTIFSPLSQEQFLYSSKSPG